MMQAWYMSLRVAEIWPFMTGDGIKLMISGRREGGREGGREGRREGGRRGGRICLSILESVKKYGKESVRRPLSLSGVGTPIQLLESVFLLYIYRQIECAAITSCLWHATIQSSVVMVLSIALMTFIL